MRYSARCMACGSSLRFNNHSERADWVGKHRVRTGHDVIMEDLQ